MQLCSGTKSLSEVERIEVKKVIIKKMETDESISRQSSPRKVIEEGKRLARRRRRAPNLTPSRLKLAHGEILLVLSRRGLYFYRFILSLFFPVNNDSGKSNSSSAKTSIVIPTSRAYLSKTGKGGSLSFNSYLEISVRMTLNLSLDNLFDICAKLQSK